MGQIKRAFHGKKAISAKRPIFKKKSEVAFGESHNRFA
jgi:hypothetical protein